MIIKMHIGIISRWNMEFVEDINEKEYDEFLKNNESHFMQTREFGEIRKEKGFIPHLVGLKDHNKLVCTALLLEKRTYHNFMYYYVPRGYTIDYNNHELLNIFTNELQKYAKKNNAIFIKIDPAIKRYSIDLDGKKVDGEDNTSLMNYLNKLGYKHLGFNMAFEHAEPRSGDRLLLCEGRGRHSSDQSGELSVQACAGRGNAEDYRSFR